MSNLPKSWPVHLALWLIKDKSTRNRTCCTSDGVASGTGCLFTVCATVVTLLVISAAACIILIG